MCKRCNGPAVRTETVNVGDNDDTARFNVTISYDRIKFIFRIGCEDGIEYAIKGVNKRTAREFAVMMNKWIGGNEAVLLAAVDLVLS